MTVTEVQPQTARPQMSDIDVFGLTHPGLRRPINEDQFFIATIHKTMQVYSSSLPAETLPELTSESRGWLFMVADGVGGRPEGEKASATALRAIAEYVTHTMRFYYRDDPRHTEASFLRDLQNAVLRSDEVVRAQAEGTATTLTMVAVRWPRAYLIQVGDSRCYRLRDGRLEQLTKDQTMAQALVDAGVLPPGAAEESRWRHVLSSAIGGRDTTPVTTPMDCRWSDVVLLCTDGLTKHVNDDEIKAELASAKSSEEICRSLLALALDRGGSDNITLVAGRLRTPAPA
jgi:protein phosphatase